MIQLVSYIAISLDDRRGQWCRGRAQDNHRLTTRSELSIRTADPITPRWILIQPPLPRQPSSRALKVANTDPDSILRTRFPMGTSPAPYRLNCPLSILGYT